MLIPKFWGTLLITMSTFALSGQSESLENVEYGHAGDYSLRMDVHIPEGRGPFPAAIIVHGGAWIKGDRKHTVEPLFQPLNDARIAWFSISYRLAGDMHTNDAQSTIGAALTLGSAVEDVKQAVAYVKEHAAEYHVDPNRVALIGESAGAQLASMAALRPAPNGKVRAVVALYSPSDLVSLAQTSPQIPESVRKAVRGTPLEDLLLAGLRDISPINWVRPDSPPFLLIHGTEDSLVPFEQSTRMCNRLHESGVACELYPVEGGGHGLRWWEHEHLTSYKTHMVDWLRKELHA